MKKTIFSVVALVILFSATTFAQIPTNGLIGSYSFSGNANDAGGSAQNGTVFGATLTTDRFGSSNSAYSFNGSTNYISIPPTNYLNNSYSYSYWMKSVVNPSSASYAFSIGTPNQPAAEGASGAINGSLSLGIDVGSYSTTSSTPQVAVVGSMPVVNQWYHVVVTRDVSFLKLYVDGTIIDSTATTGSIPQYGANPVFNIGTRFNSSNYFDGVLDDFRIYNRVINPTEVLALFNETNNCGIGYYPFTGNANDLSGNAQNGTVFGATLTTDRFGNANSAYSFNGSTNYISIPPTTYLNDLYSYSYWMKSIVNPSSASYAFSIGTPNQPAAEGASGAINGSLSLGIDVGSYSTSSSTPQVAVVGSMPFVNQWYHVVVTRDASFLKLYVDGTIIDSTATNGSVPQYGANPVFNIGTRFNSTNYFDGVLDDFRMFNCAISASDVNTLYNQELLGTGILTIESKNPVIVYPNPTNGILNLQTTQLGNFQFKIYDLMGKCIYQGTKKESTLQIDLGNQPNGVYFINIETTEGTISKKIIINK